MGGREGGRERAFQAELRAGAKTAAFRAGPELTLSLRELSEFRARALRLRTST